MLPPAPTPAPVRKAALNVFEVVNWSRRESLAAVSTGGPAEFELRLRARPPRAVAHWNVDEDRFTVEQLAEEMCAGDAEEFLRCFQRAALMPGWKALTWRE